METTKGIHNSYQHLLWKENTPFYSFKKTLKHKLKPVSYILQNIMGIN